MEFDRIKQAVEGVPVMSAVQGRVVYDHVLESECTNIIELGTHNGTSAAYMAAALHELGRGKVTTLDRAQLMPLVPPERQAFAKVPELLPFVRFERPSDSSYVWWLMRQVEARSDDAGNCETAYDFCYLDGAHDFTIDGMAVYLVERLLHAGGWLLMDDLNWSYRAGLSAYDTDVLSEDEAATPHMRQIFDVVLKGHPSFSEFKVQDGSWGWAKKAPGQQRRYTLEASHSVGGLVMDRMKRAALQARSQRVKVRG
jgi:predicted O-methyltransferase YrrM